jgi:hypothetical protein
MPPIFDPSLYATVPTRTPAATLSLARGLLAAASSEPDERVAKRITKLRKGAKLPAQGVILRGIIDFEVAYLFHALRKAGTTRRTTAWVTQREALRAAAAKNRHLVGDAGACARSEGLVGPVRTPELWLLGTAPRHPPQAQRDDLRRQ